nr:host cell division inhibitor Icd-like protein [Citrobacter sp. Marseille-Q6884]
MVDIWLTPDYFEVVIKCMTGAYQKATPRTVRAVPGRLTKPLSEVTVMADNHSTQTRPKFTWRFLAVPIIAPNAKPIVLYTNATSEQRARDNCPGWLLFFAARLPLHEVCDNPTPSGLRESLTPSTVAEIATVQEVRHV